MGIEKKQELKELAQEYDLDLLILLGRMICKSFLFKIG